MNILITAFDAFGNDKINPSELVLEKIPNKIDNKTIIKQILPTIAYKSIEIINNIIYSQKIDYILCLGLAKGIDNIRIERIAINLNDFRIEDNAKNKYIDKKIYENGNLAYMTNLPIKRICKSINDNNIKSTISLSAGSFVCNHIMYANLYNHPKIPSGFIHIPATKEIKNTKIYMELEQIVKAIILAIKEIDKEEISLDLGNIY